MRHKYCYFEVDTTVSDRNLTKVYAFLESIQQPDSAKNNRLKIKVLIPILIFIALICASLALSDETTSLTGGAKIYQWYCSPCHGINGNGKGFNAKNLDPRPANHTDKEMMIRRTDKELFDAISGGGRAVGKSTLMPPWGHTLKDSEISSLVLYLRSLCKCRGE